MYFFQYTIITWINVFVKYYYFMPKWAKVLNLKVFRVIIAIKEQQKHPKHPKISYNHVLYLN